MPFAGSLRTAVGECKGAGGRFQDCAPLPADYAGGPFVFSLTTISTNPDSDDAGDLIEVSVDCQCGGDGDVLLSTYGDVGTIAFDWGGVSLNGRTTAYTDPISCGGFCAALDVMCWRMFTVEHDQPKFTWFEWVRARFGDGE